jgi:hypothetical protein
MMTAAFISYSTKDENIARGLYSALEISGVKTFLASLSIKAGGEWTPTIFKHLEEADWIFFIASKNSCASHAVQQELGASIIQKKTIIPLLIDIEPEELPGWVGKHQAINIKEGTEAIQPVIDSIVEKIKSDKVLAGLLLVLVIGGVILAIKS